MALIDLNYRSHTREQGTDWLFGTGDTSTLPRVDSEGLDVLEDTIRYFPRTRVFVDAVCVSQVPAA